jgi:hypothetical protein
MTCNQTRANVLARQSDSRGDALTMCRRRVTPAIEEHSQNQVMVDRCASRDYAHMNWSLDAKPHAEGAENERDSICVVG